MQSSVAAIYTVIDLWKVILHCNMQVHVELTNV